MPSLLKVGEMAVLHPDAVESQYSVTLGNNSLCQRMKQCSVYT